MAFIAEDGTGLDDANSLCSLEDADAYFAERAVSAWTGTDDDKQAALIKATDYIEYRYGRRFLGTREVDTQALSFPRIDIDFDDVVPTLIKRATAEYALRALSNPLAPDPVINESSRLLLAETHKVGPLEDSFRYSTKGPGSNPMTFRPYPSADALITAFLRPSAGVVR